MRGKTHNQNRFVRIITMPFRVLGKARDFYVRSVTNCAHTVSYGNTIGCPGDLPRSFSVCSSRTNNSEDFRELVRAASTSTLVDRIGMDMLLQQHMREAAAMGSKVVVPRSCSVGMGKIDEDKPCCDFGEDTIDGKNGLFYPRSKSYAVTKRSVLVA
ncbi:hypothetical protein L1049_026084 [Liquidambar formosana]|uniref:Uncharacterized protein n=1 Tax=Liquidambar formosana TaxID=63359 RepID=A0AAP0NFQ8_LIQFO